MKDFSNARTNLWTATHKTASGMHLEGTHYENYHEGYRDDFCDMLTSQGYVTDADYSFILSQMDEYSDVGDFLWSEKEQAAEMAAFGLILFERIVQAETDTESYKDFFYRHYQLNECILYVNGRQSRQRTAKKAAKAKLANDPKQKEKKLVRECWDAWKNRPDSYKGKAAFALDMLRKWESLESQPVIEGWCRMWERETKTSLS